MSDSTAIPVSNTAQQRRGARIVAGAALLLVLAIVILPLVGSTSIDFGRALAGASPDAEILFYARLPRVLLAVLVGGALAVTGVVFQALVRDALADPYVLGVASGASLGAVLAICFGWRQVGSLPAIWLAASPSCAGSWEASSRFPTRRLLGWRYW